jgi:hypothetical protein
MKNNILMMLIFSLFLVGCGSDKENIQKNGSETGNELLPLNVEIEILPATLEPNEVVTINAYVTHGEEKVEDASEVQFQLWEKGKEDEDEFIDAEYLGSGIYSIEKTFDHDGVFYVVAHVTARDMHNMPKKELIVGDGESESEHSHDAHEDEDSSHHHQESQLAVELNPEEAKSNNETELTAKVKKNDEGFSGATISYEIWKGEAHKHEYVKASESEEKGTYIATYIFPETGTYNVRIHVESDTLHDHVEETIEIK